MDHQHVLRQAVFLKKFMPQWLHCSGKQGRGASGRWSGASGGPISSWFWVFVYLYTVVVWLLLGEKNLETGAACEGDKWQKGPREIFHHQTVLHYTLPPLPLHLLPITMILILLLLILLLLLLFKEVWKATRPSLLSCKKGTGLLLPQVPKYWQILNYS